MYKQNAKGKIIGSAHPVWWLPYTNTLRECQFQFAVHMWLAANHRQIASNMREGKSTMEH